MHAIETAHHVAIHHVHHGLGDCIIQALIGVHALLDDHLIDFHAIFDHTHFVFRLAIERIQLFHIAHRHDAHTISAVVCFYNDKGLFLDSVFLVFTFDLGEQGINVGSEAIHAQAFLKIHFATLGKHRIDQPWINAQQLAKAFREFFIRLEMLRFAAHMPARMQRRQQKLLVHFFQNTRHACAQVIVEQNRAWVKIFEPQTAMA